MARKVPWGVVSIILAVGGLDLVFVGCGSDTEDIGTLTDDGGDGSSSSGGSSGAASSSGTTTSSGGSSGGSSSGSTGGDAGDAGTDASLLDGQVCLLVGQACGLASDCCTKVCNKVGTATVGECAPPADGGGGGCLAGGADCTSPTECCTKSCISGKCSSTNCKADSPVAETCTFDAECCSGNCDEAGTGKCVALTGGTCRTEGNPCTVNNDCCSKQCDATKHCNNASFCTQTGDVCANDFECCGGSCDKASGAALGRCATIGAAACNPAGTICTTSGCDNLCCSLACGPLGTTGVNVCQPPSGCRPQNELCAENSDCCGGPGQPTGHLENGDVAPTLMCIKEDAGDTFGRCPFAQCLRPGAVCNIVAGTCGGSSNNCCEGSLPDGGLVLPSYCNNNPSKCCTKDVLGIPRCRAVLFDCTDAGVPAGQACATSADCCGKPCVNNKCEGTCVAKGGACTINADCCAPEPCVVPTGSTNGICGGVLESDGGVSPPPDSGTSSDGGTSPDSSTCALYGQNCTAAGDCCSGVPCSGGLCRYP